MATSKGHCHFLSLILNNISHRMCATSSSPCRSIRPRFATKTPLPATAASGHRAIPAASEAAVAAAAACAKAIFSGDGNVRADRGMQTGPACGQGPNLWKRIDWRDRAETSGLFCCRQAPGMRRDKVCRIFDSIQRFPQARDGKPGCGKAAIKHTLGNQ